jgi:hypothetical protein
MGLKKEEEKSLHLQSSNVYGDATYENPETSRELHDGLTLMSTLTDLSSVELKSATENTMQPDEWWIWRCAGRFRPPKVTPLILELNPKQGSHGDVEAAEANCFHLSRSNTTYHELEYSTASKRRLVGM